MVCLFHANLQDDVVLEVLGLVYLLGHHPTPLQSDRLAGLVSQYEWRAPEGTCPVWCPVGIKPSLWQNVGVPAANEYDHFPLVCRNCM